MRKCTIDRPSVRYSDQRLVLMMKSIHIVSMLVSLSFCMVRLEHHCWICINTCVFFLAASCLSRSIDDFIKLTSFHENIRFSMKNTPSLSHIFPNQNIITIETKTQKKKNSNAEERLKLTSSLAFICLPQTNYLLYEC